MKQRAILYARVSTDEQAEHGYSVQSQVEALQKYAEEHDFEVVAVFREDYTGTKLDRPEMGKVREMMKQQAADAIIVFSPDRLTRSLAHALILREEFQVAGIELHYVNRGKSQDSAEGRMTENIEAVFAEYWWEKIIEGGRRGKLAKAKSGKWVGSGRPPFGYCRLGKGHDARLAFHEDEIEVVKRIHGMYLGQGGLRPHSLRRMAATLTIEQVPPPNRGPGGSIGWHIEALRIILDSRAYLGEFRYAGQVARFPELAIIDEATYQKIQDRRAENRVLAQRNAKHEYLLLGGYFKCRCGANMTCRTQVRNGKAYRYYVCWRECERYLDRCHEKSIRADKIDPVVWSWVKQFLEDEDNLEAGLRRMQERREVELGPNRQRLQVVRQLIEQTDKQVKRLAKALTAADNEAVADALETELKVVGRALTDLKKEAAVLEAALGQGALAQAEIDAIKRLAAELREELASPTYATQRFLMDRLHVLVQIRHQGDQRWIDVTCEISPDPSHYLIETGTSLRTARCSSP